ncbi:MAG: cell division protein ZapA [Rhizobiales bacterium]|nr:cell division protein ZapA [Hyphomicrobiales bacterium]
MASVSVTINGKTYRMACDEGQESHLVSLAEKLDSYAGQLKGSFGEIGDQRLTVMAGIMVTDELVEMEKKIAGLEAKIAKLEQTNTSVTGEMSSAETDAAKQISQLANKLNAIVGKLNG